jgi:hypothetical protein
MSFWIIACLIIALYIKTLNYHYIIDDYVKRHEYLWVVPDKSINPQFFDNKPSPWYRAFMIGMHIVNSYIIYTLWGWAPSLLFAVHPMGVWGTAWVTGNYYATTAYFTLISYFFFTKAAALLSGPAVSLLLADGIITSGGALAIIYSLSGAVFFFCALHSTVDAMSYPFFLLLTGNIPGLLSFIPLTIFLNCKRWKKGLGIRKDIVAGRPVDQVGWIWRRPIFMTKVVGRYLITAIAPVNVYFFDKWGEDVRNDKTAWNKYHTVNREFWVCLVISLTVFITGLLVHPVGTLWLFIFIGLHSQFVVLGQCFAQRYLYLPLAGLCAIYAGLFSAYPQAIYFLAGLYAMKTWHVIPNFKTQEALLRNEVASQPDRAGSYNALAQYFISRKNLKAYQSWEINYIGSLIRHAYALSPNSWVISMNFCAYLVMIGRLKQAIEMNKNTITLMQKYASTREKKALPGAEKQLKWLEGLKAKADAEYRRQNKKRKKGEKKREKTQNHPSN